MIHLVRPLSAVFATLPDVRRSQGKRHSIVAVLTLVTLALINQQNSLGQMAAWLQGLSPQVRQQLHLRFNRVPSKSTLRRVLVHLDAQALAQALHAWVNEIASAGPSTAPLQGLAMDGKTLRHSADPEAELPAVQVLNAMLHTLGAMLNSHAIPAGTNELGFIQAFLAETLLAGRVVTLDAFYTHPSVAQAILDRGGHYLIRVKANQPRLMQALDAWFDAPSPFIQADTRAAEHTDKSHGRLVHYTLRTTAALQDYLRDEFSWPAVGQVMCIERRCISLSTGQVTTTRHYAITSLSIDQATPARLFQLWHQHWHIENQGHWVLDIVFGEDASRARKGPLPHVLSLLRQLVMTLLRYWGQLGITAMRSVLSANVSQAAAFVGFPLE